MKADNRKAEGYGEGTPERGREPQSHLPFALEIFNFSAVEILEGPDAWCPWPDQYPSGKLRRRPLNQAGRRAASRKRDRLRRKKRNTLEGQPLEKFLKYRKAGLVSRRGRAARRKGLEFTITVATLKWPSHCPILGIELDYLTRGAIKHDLPTIDRVDPRHGYHAWNARVVSFKANTLKNACTREHLEMILDYVRRVEDEKPKDAES